MSAYQFKQDFEKRMLLFKNNPVVSWHEHVWMDKSGNLNENEFFHLRKSAEAACFDYVVSSLPFTDPMKRCTPEDFRHVNKIQYVACQKWDKLYGMGFINSGYTKEALEEIDRCVYDYGFIGFKLYHQYFIDEPVLYPIVEKCIQLDVPILVHAGHSPHFNLEQPRLSGSEHFAGIAKVYPEANIIMAHIGGGGDWQWQIKGIVDTPSIVCDMSGSVVDAPMIEQAVKLLGAERILFGTDMSVEACVGKILAANISEEDKKTILAGTAYRRFLKRRG